MMATMKAVRAHQRGGPEVLVYEDAPVPSIGPNDVLIEVHAAAITYTELLWEETWMRNGLSRTPIIPSHEASGRVAAIGAAVTDLGVGDEIFGLFPFDHDGAAAEYAVLPRNCAATVPSGMDPATAAALPLAALTAWQALVDFGEVGAGDEVLVDGGAGGVGQFAIQIGRELGAHVTATARRSDVELVTSLGANDVIITDTEPDGLPTRRFDVLLFTRPGSPDEAEYMSVREGGTLVTLNGPPSEDLMKRHGVRGRFFIVAPDTAEMNHLAELAVAGRLRVSIAAEFPLSEARRAYESGADHSRPPGKTILLVRSREDR